VAASANPSPTIVTGRLERQAYMNKCLATQSLLAVVLLLGSLSAGAAQAVPAAQQVYLRQDGRVDSLLARMTLAEKIGQMTQADQEFLADTADVGRYLLGSILSGGNSDPREGDEVPWWTNLYDRLQRQSLTTRLGIPLLYGIDAVHGHSNVAGAVIFPHNIGLGATRDTSLVRRIGEVTAREMRATGIHWTFAPCVCVPRDERWGRTYEGFSEDPALTAQLGAASIRGLQGADLKAPLSVLACAKHYAGDGGTAPGTGGPGGRGLDQGDVRLGEAEFRRIHIAPYAAAVQAGVGSIMPSYSSWNGEKMSGNRYLLTAVLKEELGFAGFLVSDYRAVDQLDRDYERAIEKSINAGMDMVMVPDRYQEFIAALSRLVETGRVPRARIDDAVRRILRVKFAMGLLDRPGQALRADRTLHASVGSAAHRVLAREAVQKSLVVLKNERGVLPLAATAARIHVAGRGADDIGMQSGGWTIDWQGGTGPITIGTTILQAIRSAAGSERVTHAADGSGAAGADVGVVVIGETPYAEGRGDRLDLALDPGDVAAVRRVHDAGIPVVVILLSGRPLILGEVLELADGVIAAWLPGTEGDGVADILFGRHPATGKLPYTWPRTMAQLPINVGDPDIDPLFPFGYGLTW
jgi:beta-glucosidase